MNHISTFASGKSGRAKAITNALVGIILCIGFYAANARAEPRPAPQVEDPSPIGPPEDVRKPRSYLLSVRPLNVGTGVGNLGIGARFGMAGEYWLTDVFGVGLEGGASGQLQLLSASSGSVFVGPTFDVRSAPRGGYFIATFGVGYASVDRSTGGGICVTDQCVPAQNTHYDGHSISAAVGWLFHPGDLEIGPVVHLDAVGGGQSPADYLVTANFELGYAVRRR